MSLACSPDHSPRVVTVPVRKRLLRIAGLRTGTGQFRIIAKRTLENRHHESSTAGSQPRE